MELSGAVGLGDIAVVRHALGDDAAEWLAKSLGFERQEPVKQSEPAPSRDPGTLPPPKWVAPEVVSSEMPVWRLVGATFHDIEEAPERAPELRVPLADSELDGDPLAILRTPPPPPLAPWSRLWPVLREALGTEVSSRDPDVPAVMQALACGDVLREIPRRQRRAWCSRVLVLVDRSPRLVPVWSDQLNVITRLWQVMGRQSVTWHRLGPFSDARALADLAAIIRRLCGLDQPETILALTDLGSYADDGARDAWVRAARRLRRIGHRPRGLVPVALGRLRREAAVWEPQQWERNRCATIASSVGGATTHERRAERLLALASTASRVEPGLLRAMRQLLPAAHADVGTEVDAWRRAASGVRGSAGFTLSGEEAVRLQGLLKQESEDLRRRVADLVANWQARLPDELRLESEWRMTALGRAPFGEDGRLRALAERVAASAAASAEQPAGREVRSWFRRVATRLPAPAWKHPVLSRMLGLAWISTHQSESDAAVPKFLDPKLVREALGAGEGPRWLTARQVGKKVELVPAARPWEELRAPGSPLAAVRLSNPQLFVNIGEVRLQRRASGGENAGFDLAPESAVIIETDACRLEIEHLSKPSWAKDVGRDRFGLFADLYIRGVEVRLRWIPPGRFAMGSPEGEQGRLHREGPQHEICFARGFWMGETPVTQALWTAVQGGNPSHFCSPDRPVEQVSWDECKSFIDTVNRDLSELHFKLPGEAEWEYACRAGTNTSSYAGELQIMGENDAPILDRIGWYGGNSGVLFELENGHNSTKWREKQHPNSPSGTHPVKQRNPNAFGLYDMLGNVWEWCEDGFLEYIRSPDPLPVIGGEHRVVRGGSWRGRAKSVRAATRGCHDPDSRSFNLGFRLLARGQEGPKAKEQSSEAAGGSASRAAAQVRASAGAAARAALPSAAEAPSIGVG